MYLTLTEASGNAINIYNNTNDANGNPFVGSGNFSWRLVATASTGNKLTLTRTDGGPINIFDNAGTFEANWCILVYTMVFISNEC